jgi:hypothetical protein
VENERVRPADVLRYKPVVVGHAWPIDNTYRRGLATISYSFDFDNGVSATGV